MTWLPQSCMGHLAAKLPKLHRGLHQAAQATQIQSSSTGEHTCLVQQSCNWGKSTAAHHLRCLQAFLRSRLGLTSADWLRTCTRSGTVQPMSTMARLWLHLRGTGKYGGGAACARLSSRTGGRQQSAIAQVAKSAPTMLAEQCAPTMIWPTTSQRWQRSGTGRPAEKGDQ